MRLLQLSDPIMHGEDVRSIQGVLLAMGYDLGQGGVDGWFGMRTEAVVRRFQEERQVPGGVDGIVGPYTLAALQLLDEWQARETPSSLQTGWYFPPPQGRAQWRAVYGEPTGRASWESAHLAFCDLSPLRWPRRLTADAINEKREHWGLPPNLYAASQMEVHGLGHLYYPLADGRRLDWLATRRDPRTGEVGYGLVIHRLCVAVYYELFARLLACDLLRHLRTVDGSYVFRNTRRGTQLSTHAYGMAVDLDASWNPFGQEPVMHPEIVQIAEDMGFTWGGRWRQSDGMHFQWGEE
ncbi:MAG: M15 family metallopeptidase [Candidatus Lernaella stagnicola]|nr:M15 family metallopeptidase [Candidatus Lernaella stagnicola]